MLPHEENLLVLWRQEQKHLVGQMGSSCFLTAEEVLSPSEIWGGTQFCHGAEHSQHTGEEGKDAGLSQEQHWVFHRLSEHKGCSGVL